MIVSTHFYIPIDGVADEVKLDLLARLNAPNEQYNMARPAIIFGPSYDASHQGADRHVPNHAELTLEFVTAKELERALERGDTGVLFIWAEESVLEASDPTARVISVDKADEPGDPPVVEELRAAIPAIAGVANGIDSGNISFGELQDMAGEDGVFRW
ncbi:hypothetical protein BOTBODRAFT_471102 [Botryobasidium botryosum FD-172 SS1]|uniref:DUF6924 domain-containing protein n=1 Tax=Botryobasidium botryosum (strain FD-172 SS1) TaxID=930990 RepID=A0A067M5R0_BOTB1|nr:hypothetical protein BOTBODRAFT_471102 [Botryobasidium botryosum FD-172 SS1]